MNNGSILGILTVTTAITFFVFPGCGAGESGAGDAGPLGAGEAGEAGGGSVVGDPCTPEQEDDTEFNGFDYRQVTLDSKSLQCQTRLCLVNHFQGRVSCPYGQDAKGKPSSGSVACFAPWFPDAHHRQSIRRDDLGVG